MSAALALSILAACGGAASSDDSSQALLGLVPTGSAHLQSTQAISAYLTDSDGVPVANTTVTFQQAGVRSVAESRGETATTDDDGLFSVLLAPQTYTARAGDLEFELIVYTDGSVASGTDGIVVGRHRREPPLRLKLGGSRAVDEGTTASIKVSLMYRPRGPVTFQVSLGRAAGGSGGLTVGTSELHFRPANYDEPQTIRVGSVADGRIFDRPVEVVLHPQRGDTLAAYALFYDTDAPDLTGYDLQVSGASGVSLAPRRETRVAVNPVGGRVVAFSRTANPPQAFAFDCAPDLSGCAEHYLAGADAFGRSLEKTRRHAYDALADQMIFFQAGTVNQAYMRCDADGTNCEAPVILRHDTAYSAYEGVEMMIDPLDHALIIIIADWAANIGPTPGHMLVYRCDLDTDRCSIRTLPAEYASRFAAVFDERDRRLLVAINGNPGPVLACDPAGGNCSTGPSLQYVSSAALDRKNDRLFLTGFRTNYSTGAEYIAQRSCTRDGAQCTETVIGPLPEDLSHSFGLYVPQISRMVYTLSGWDVGDALYSCKPDGSDCRLHDLRGQNGTAPLSTIWNVVYDPGTMRFSVGAAIGPDSTVLQTPLAPY